MSTVATRKCVRHEPREAVARCPSCGEHFCRECVVEHAGVLLCSACLADKLTAGDPGRRGRGQRAREWTLTAGSLLLLWVVFYGFGQFLKLVPPTVHEGTVWRMRGVP